MRLGRIVTVLFVGLLFATRAWGEPENWAVWVPTHANYTHSSAGSFGGFWGAPYDKSGIDHIWWFGCWWGHLCTDDQTAFKHYEIGGDYYDCEGNLRETNARTPYGTKKAAIVRGTGTIFDGGIGGVGGGTEPACGSSNPAKDCRVYIDMSPVKRRYWSCDPWPFVGPPKDGANTGKNLGRPRRGMCELFVGNPINVATGNKYEEALDITVSSPGIPLEFRRSYNSQSIYDGPLGYGWTHTYSIWLEEIQVEDDPARRVVIWDWDGRALYFDEIRPEQGSSDTPFAVESGVKDRLRQIEATGEYLLSRKQGNLSYRFDPEGELIAIADLNGNELLLSYEEERLSQVSSNFGKTLSFHYRGDGLIDWVRDPRGEYVYYDYENRDLTLANYSDGNSVSYDYSNHNLTDKYDTESRLIGHWEYDDKEKVILYYSHLKDGIPQSRIDLRYEFLKTEVAHPWGVTIYTIQIIDGVHLVKEIEGCSSCLSVNRRFDYSPRLDLVGVTSIDGEKEITTEYVYDDPTIPWEQVGEVVEKTEALGWDEERTTLYSYTFDQTNPLLVREKVETRESVLSPEGENTTKWTYDEAGNLISREETGYVLIGEPPTPIITTYLTEYHYTDLGQLEWIDGPRTDVSDRTDFEYYENDPSEGDNRGQLKAIVNALGHRTEFSDYDANGNVGRIIDPNGVVTRYTYDERNRVRTVTNQATGGVTEYIYDSHGEIDDVILPEGDVIDYGHDLADRLTEIKDALGNRISYTPDTEGNIEMEEIFDSEGVVTKTVSMEYSP